MASDLEELVKALGDSSLYDMDFSSRMSSGESISGVTSVTASNSNRVENSTSIVIGDYSYSGNKTQVRLSGGTAGEIYKILFIVTTNLGNTKTGEGLLRVK